MPTASFRQLFLRLVMSVVVLLAIAACGVVANVPAQDGATHLATPPSLETAASAAPAESTPVPPPTVVPSPTVSPIPVGDGLSSTGFVLPLTTQHVADNSAELYFELSAPVDGVLIYQSTDGSTGELSMPFDSATPAHQLILSGLSAGTSYRALVIVKDADGQYRRPGFLESDWGDVSFRTWSEKQPIRFGIIGDSGFGDSVTPRLADQMAAANLDFSLQVGDIVYNIYDNKDPFEAFALKYYKPFSPVLHQMPMYLVVGNHDVENAAIWNGQPFYDHAFPPFADSRYQPPADGHQDWYAFAYGDVQFLMLNTEAMNNSKERQNQKAWLADRLADTRFAVNIPVFHVAPYTGGAHVSDGLAVRADWVPLFQQAGVKLVLTAHDHNYQRLIEDGITYVVSGGGSATLYSKTQDVPGSQFFARISHFVVFEIYPGRIDFKAIALGGDVIDQASVPLQ